MGTAPRRGLVPRQKSEIWNSSLTSLNGQIKWGVFWVFHERSIYWFSISFPSTLLTQIKSPNQNPKALTSLYFLSLINLHWRSFEYWKRRPNSQVFINKLEAKVLIKVWFLLVFGFLSSIGPLKEIFKLLQTMVFSLHLDLLLKTKLRINCDELWSVNVV